MTKKGIKLAMLTVLATMLVAGTGAAERTDTYSLDIEAQPLAGALKSLADQTGLQVVFFSEIADGLESDELHGMFTAGDALNRLLVDTDLTYEYLSDDAIEVRPVEDSGGTAPTSDETPETEGPAGSGENNEVQQEARHNEEPASSLEEPAADEPAQQEPEEADAEEPAAGRTFAAEVVVTAQKREQALQDIPISIQAFEGAAMDDVNIRDLNEIMTFVPGASEGDASSVAHRRFQIRGIPQGPGDPTVGYYLDDSAFFIYGQSFAPVGRTFDVQRVEVLRGPQSTLYGNGSMGGTVRYITKAPNLSRVEGQLRAAYSATDGGDPGSYFDAAVSVPLVANKLGLRLVGSYQEIGGYHEIPSEGLENTNPADLTNLRASLLWTPTDRLTLQLLYARTTAEQTGGTLLASTDPPISDRLPGDFHSVDYDLYYGTLTYAFDGATLSSTTTFIDLKDEISVGADLGPFTLNLFLGGDSYALNNETRLVSNGGGALQWLAGVFYSESEYDAIFTIDPPIIAPGESLNTSESISLFGEVSWAFLDGRLVPLIGLRYFEDDRSVFDSTAGIQAPPATFDSVNPRFNLSYLPTDNSNYYLNIAKGFRSGSFNLPEICALHIALAGMPCQVALDSDQLWSYEIGTKQTLADGQVLLDAALYYQDWVDMRQSVPIGILAAEYQIGDAVVPGIDLQLTYTPASISGLTLRATGNWNDAHMDSIDPALGEASGAEEGDRLRLVPGWTAALAATYSWAVSATWMGQVAVGYSHIDAQLGWIGTDAVGDSRDLVRARFGFDNGSFGLYLFGNNLLNESGAIYSQTPDDGVDAFTRDYPRQVGLEITYSF